MDNWFHPQGAPRSEWVRRRTMPVLVGLHAISALVLVAFFHWPGALLQLGLTLLTGTLGRQIATAQAPQLSALVLFVEVLAQLAMTIMLGQAPLFLLLYLPLAVMAIHLLPETLRLQASMVGLCVTGFLMCELWPPEMASTADSGPILLGTLHLINVAGAFGLLYAATPAEH